MLVIKLKKFENLVIEKNLDSFASNGWTRLNLPWSVSNRKQLKTFGNFASSGRSHKILKKIKRGTGKNHFSHSIPISLFDQLWSIIFIFGLTVMLYVQPPVTRLYQYNSQNHWFYPSKIRNLLAFQNESIENRLRNPVHIR